MQAPSADNERSFLIGQRAIELMKAYGSSAHPKSYEVWYTYVSGHKPLMNDAIKRMTSERGTISDQEIETLYDAHLSAERFSDQAEQASENVLGEIDDIMEMMDFALGSTAKYGASLEALSHDLSGNIDHARLREIVGSLVHETRDTVETNRTLDARLKETRGEIATLRETLEAVRVESLTDSLTGIANRKHFEDMLMKAASRAEAHRAPLALLVIDIDHFKRFNDTYGHLTGDQVLRLVAMTMRENVKSKATLARFGGEEFGIILPEATLDGAMRTAEQIRLSVMSRELVKRSTGESLGKVTISTGVAAFRPGDTAVSLLERADHCMYTAKRTGRNRVTTDAECVAPDGLPNVA